MRINQALVKHLKDAETLAGDNVYPAPLPEQAALPALTYQRIDEIPAYAFAEGETGFTAARFQVDVWATTKQDVENCALEVRRSLSGFSGLLGEDRDAVVFLLNAIDDFDADTARYRIIQDYRIQYTEEI